MKKLVITVIVLLLAAGWAMAGGKPETLSMSGISTFSAYASRTGALVSDPTMNQCEAGCEFTIVSKSKGELITTERCAINEDLTFVREIDWGTVTIGADGRITLRVPRTYTSWNDVGGKREDVASIDFLATVAEHTGCRPFGSIPQYEGGFNGTNLYFSTQMHDICDGGNLWADMLGVSEELGALVVSFGFDLQVE